jgi:hypothetical protein
MKIAVLGAGPSGMMAAHASSQYGHYVDILDWNPSQSRRNSGVYFLHDDCDLALDSHSFHQRVLGIGGMTYNDIGQAYGEKVYGKRVGKVSVLSAIVEKEVRGYSAGQAINRLWDLYGNQIQNREIRRGMYDVEDLLGVYDKVISTIPAYVLFPEKEFDSVATWIKVGIAPPSEHFIFYNLNPHCPWYRCSGMFGVFVQEYGFDFSPPENWDDTQYQYRVVQKVIGEGIVSPFKNLLLTGRYGAWNKRILTHNVYEEVLDWLSR